MWLRRDGFAIGVLVVENFRANATIGFAVRSERAIRDRVAGGAKRKVNLRRPTRH